MKLNKWHVTNDTLMMVLILYVRINELVWLRSLRIFIVSDPMISREIGRPDFRLRFRESAEVDGGAVALQYDGDWESGIRGDGT